MREQVHKRVTDEQAKTVLRRYCAGEITSAQAMALLGLKRRQFFEWAKRYRGNPEGFTVQYERKKTSRRLDCVVETHILDELAVEKALINDPAMPVRFYNYSYIQEQIRKNYQEKVSLPTIIDRAKKTAFIDPSRKEPYMITRFSPTMPVNSSNTTPLIIDGRPTSTTGCI